MGLDNIPKIYPCEKNGTAVKLCRTDRDGKDILNEDGTPDLEIDCDLTMEAGGCPWKNANPPKGAVYGIFGVPCWYRGKAGNTLMARYADPATPNLNDESFYGDIEDGTEKTPESCLRLADHVAQVREHNVSDEYDFDALTYAEWYLRWAAENTDGLICWY